MEAYFMEKMNLKSVAVPVDLNTAAITGARVSMKSADRVTFLVLLGVSLTGGVVDVTLRQHSAASGGTSKALAVTNPYFVKAGAATEFTEVVPSSATSNYVLSTTFDTASGIVVFEVLAEDLDVNGGFAWVSVDLADGGVAKPGAVLAVCGGLTNLPGYSQTI